MLDDSHAIWAFCFPSLLRLSLTVVFNSHFIFFVRATSLVPDWARYLNSHSKFFSRKRLHKSWKTLWFPFCGWLYCGKPGALLLLLLLLHLRKVCFDLFSYYLSNYLCQAAGRRVSIIFSGYLILVCGYTGGCIKCTTDGLKLVVLSDNITTCCTSNIATIGAEYINVYEKPSDCPAWLERKAREYEILMGEIFKRRAI